MLLEHTYREDGIHEIVLYAGTIEVTDQFVELMSHIYDNLPADAKPRILLDSTQTPHRLPLSYFLTRFRIWNEKYKNRPPGKLAHIARTNATMLTVFNGLLRTFVRKNDELRLYAVDERDKALAWLRDESD